MKPQLPKPNTYIKIRDIEQLKLLCEYKNDEVHRLPSGITENAYRIFKKGTKYFKWDNLGDGYVSTVIEGYTELTDDSFLYPTKPMKEKKQKQEVFDNQFKVGQWVFVYTEGKIEHKEIDAVLKFQYELNFGENNPVFFEENQLYKTKSQLIKSLSKQWREEVEERILNLNK